MDKKVLENAVAMGKSYLKLISTCSETGVPHMAAAGEIVLLGSSQIALTDWFCPGTISNARPGREISVVVWNPSEDTGHQLIGKVVRVEEVAISDGYIPKEEERPMPPNVERRLVVDVYKILEFCKKPHSDLEE